MNFFRKNQKVICIGLQKTATNSVGKALEILGHKVCGWDDHSSSLFVSGDHAALLKKMKSFDGFHDTPWSFLYKEFDKQYAGCKFILTTRNPELWIASMKKYFSDRPSPSRRWFYGTDVISGNEKQYLDKFHNHHALVREYFANRPNSLLELDIDSELNWPKLCEFINAPIPSEPFPRLNVKGK